MIVARVSERKVGHIIEAGSTCVRVKGYSGNEDTILYSRNTLKATYIVMKVG